MKKALLSCLTIVVCLGFLRAVAPESESGKPHYTSDNQLLPPNSVNGFSCLQAWA